uniref:Uncharacterized protein n=1 Tax=Setaria viridis TaxID=4556 RepID=A0A4U6TPS9_SETVI|nr:hypothetical protein SEVIR_8G050000v2 [Setaria viridis]
MQGGRQEQAERQREAGEGNKARVRRAERWRAPPSRRPRPPPAPPPPASSSSTPTATRSPTLTALSPTPASSSPTLAAPLPHSDVFTPGSAQRPQIQWPSPRPRQDPSKPLTLPYPGWRRLPRSGIVSSPSATTGRLVVVDLSGLRLLCVMLDVIVNRSSRSLRLLTAPCCNKYLLVLQ